MTVLELLASQLDREVKDFELKATEHTFSENIDFWTLCLNAKQMFMEQKANEKDNLRRD